MEHFTITLGDREHDVRVVREEKKRLRLSVQPDGEIVVDAYKSKPLREIKAFVAQHGTWLKRQVVKQTNAILLRKLEPREEALLRNELYLEAVLFYSDIKRIETTPRVGMIPRRIQIRAQKTRWGSCSTSGTISLNVYLMLLPQEIREYVFIHELCHLWHPNHSKMFWESLEKLCPDYKARKAALNQYRLPV